jgi:hypothetical protein
VSSCKGAELRGLEEVSEAESVDYGMTLVI